MSPRSHYSVQEFSKIVGISQASIHRYKKAGTLRTIQLGGPRSRILIPADALERYLATTAAPSQDKPISSVSVDIPSAESTRRSGPAPRWRRGRNI